MSRYGEAMIEGRMDELTPQAVEQTLRDDLSHDDLALAAVRPILRHLLTNDDQSLFSDEIMARVRGMVRDVAGQLLEAQAAAAEIADRIQFAAEHTDPLATALFEQADFLAYCHALAVEGQWLERLRGRSGMDPVLTPLIQELAARANPAQAALAMTVLAAQARFVQYHRRMELPLRDLPGDLFHTAVLALRATSGKLEAAAETAERRLRGEYVESAGRLALFTRLVTGMEARARRALAIDHSGLSIFATALAMATRQDRGGLILALGGRHFARLALSLRAAGQADDAIAAQFALLDPQVALPEGFNLLRSDSAVALLSASPAEAAF